MDPELIGPGGDRDFAKVGVRLRGDNDAPWQLLRLPAFMAHLANPMSLIDPEAVDGTGQVFRDGSWTGTLLWDSAVLVSELLLGSETWRTRLRGRSVVELGCGLGLPGQICALLGSAPVLLTDRGAVAALAEEGCRANSGLTAAHGVTLEWEANAAQQLREDWFGGAAPGVIIACDCIFARLFGVTFLLLRILSALASPETHIIVALERRPEDGAKDFFKCADEAGFETTLLLRDYRVVVCEMRLSLRGLD